MFDISYSKFFDLYDVLSTVRDIITEIIMIKNKILNFKIIGNKFIKHLKFIYMKKKITTIISGSDQNNFWMLKNLCKNLNTFKLNELADVNIIILI